MRAPTHRAWPKGLREIAGSRHLYRDLELLRALSPIIMIWVIENWASPRGHDALKILETEGALSLTLRIERGEFKTSPWAAGQ